MRARASLPYPVPTKLTKMSSSCAAASYSYLAGEKRPPPPGSAGGGGDAATAKEEYDFVEQPSQHYFCPVTFELLFHPEQTTCCGHHISNEAVTRIQRDKKPCPICNKPNLTTMPDKFFRRKVHELKVRCSHKKGGCEWVGDLGSYDDHVKKCLKRPWSCEFCDFDKTYDIVIEHLQNCVKRPIPCPNACEVKTVPFCDVESHLLECPLQLVACELAHAGCSAQVARRDFPLHMKESVQQHLLSASLLNLQLTRDKIEKQEVELKKKDEEMALKDQQLVEIEKERDEQRERDLKDRGLKHTEIIKEKDLKHAEMIKEKDLKHAEMVKEKDLKYAEMIIEKDLKHAELGKDYKKQLATQGDMMAEKDRQITELEKKIYAGVVSLKKEMKESCRTTEEHFAKQDGQINVVQDRLLQVSIAGVTCHNFTLNEFAKCQTIGEAGDWGSDPFYSHPGGCRLQLTIETNASSCRSTHIAAWLRLIKGDNDRRLTWPVEVEVRLVMLNQLGDHTHHSVTKNIIIIRRSEEFFDIADPFFRKSELSAMHMYKKTEYLKDDCLHFRLHIRKI